MNNYKIFVSSSDAYSDIWPVFFDMFKLNWPNFDGDIYLNTESEEFSSDGLNIISTKVGKHKGFGSTLRAGLEKVNSDYVLLIMIDYIFMDTVKVDDLKKYYDFFITNQLDSFCLVNLGYPNQKETADKDINLVYPPAPNLMFSYQTAFWKKDILNEMALPHESPWMSEWFGSKRAEKMRISLACPSKEYEMPITYDLAGCLHQGKWMQNAVEYLKSQHYQFDFSKRGFYIDGYATLSFRIKIKLKIWMTGLKGSYLDLMKRKAKA